MTADNYRRLNRTSPASEMFSDDGELQRLMERAVAANERRLASEAAKPPPAVDPIAARARHLADRAEVLLAGDFGRREVDRCRADDPGSTAALEHARAFMRLRADEKAVLVLHGGTGCGKTTAATWLAREVGGARPGMISSTKFERRGRYDHDGADWLDERTLVVVDDFGVEFMDGKGAFRSLVDELVNDATRNYRRLVITSNLGPDELADRVGERVWSRWCEGALVAGCGDRDLRRLAR